MTTKHRQPEHFKAPAVFDAPVTLGDTAQLPSFTVAELAAMPSPEDGMLVRCSDGDAGSPCLAMYDVDSFKRISLGLAVSES